MGTEIKRQLYWPYKAMLLVYLVFIVFAFLLDSPDEILRGLIQIITSRSILITDYVELGGIGATLVNSVIVGCFGILLMFSAGIKPNGATIMALWLTTGFAFFGKNVFNMLPLTFGVWLYAKYQRQPFMNYTLNALLVAAISPIISELTFMGAFPPPVGLILGVLLGIGAGFVFPPLSAYLLRVHGGYNLYNLGFTGGLIATFVASILKSVGVVIVPVSIWNQGYTFVLAIFLYVISLLLILFGLCRTNIKESFQNVGKMMKQSGRLVTDFYFQFGDSVYLNMGFLCAAATTTVLLIGGDLNGPTIGGIFTIVGYGALGKHLRNTSSVVAGAILSTYVNMWDPTSPENTLAILFCTALSPIAGQYGWRWGVAAGFLHVNIALTVGSINNGLNLYNNGFAAGFVAMLLIPIIDAIRRESQEE